MGLISIAPFLLLFAVSRGQSPVHTSYDWRTPSRLHEWPQISSLLPYERSVVPDTYLADPAPVDFPKHFPDHSGAHSEESYSAEYEKIPYVRHGEVDQSLSSSFENYDGPRQEELNMSTARIGGFAGSGDTRGFGAYDFPNNHRVEPSQRSIPPPPPPRHSKMDPDLSDLLRIGKDHHAGFPDPDTMLMHPLPPPL